MYFSNWRKTYILSLCIFLPVIYTLHVYEIILHYITHKYIRLHSWNRVWPTITLGEIEFISNIVHFFREYLPFSTGLYFNKQHKVRPNPPKKVQGCQFLQEYRGVITHRYWVASSKLSTPHYYWLPLLAITASEKGVESGAKSPSVCPWAHGAGTGASLHAMVASQLEGGGSQEHQWGTHKEEDWAGKYNMFCYLKTKIRVYNPFLNSQFRI